MSIKIHRKIWIKHFGKIPVDDTGRTFEIHHINGNHNDNRIENLQCVSINEHFAIHFKQGDFLAAAAIMRRIGTSPEIQKELNALAGKKAGASSLKNQTGWHNPDVKRRGGENTKGFKWFNNGVSSTRSVVAPGSDWVPGRLTKDKKFGFEKGRVLGTFWNKDGINKRSVNCPGVGWVPGRFLTESQKMVRQEISRKVSIKRWNINKK